MNLSKVFGFCPEMLQSGKPRSARVSKKAPASKIKTAAQVSLERSIIELSSQANLSEEGTGLTLKGVIAGIRGADLKHGTKERLEGWVRGLWKTGGPDADIEAKRIIASVIMLHESRERKMDKSDGPRERLERTLHPDNRIRVSEQEKKGLAGAIEVPEEIQELLERVEPNVTKSK